VNAQQVSEDARLKQAKEIIMEGAACAIRLRQSFMGRRLINMAMSLSQVWGLELYPSVVLQETAHLFAAYRNSWLQNLATFLSEMVSSRRVSASLFVAIGVEISRMLSTIRAQCIVPLSFPISLFLSGGVCVVCVSCVSCVCARKINTSLATGACCTTSGEQ
jgi:hypothetical protein